MPKRLELELAASKEHFEQTGRCLLCDMLHDEVEAGSRIIIENDDFYAFLPFYSEYPYGMYIAVSYTHLLPLADAPVPAVFAGGIDEKGTRRA